MPAFLSKRLGDEGRFIVWLYDRAILDEDNPVDERWFDELHVAMENAVRLLGAGRFRHAIITDEAWTELDRVSADEIQNGDG